MTLGNARHKPQDALPTSSMADIAFLLLIFFLVTTVFPKDFGLALELPQEEADVSARNMLIFEVGVDGIVGVRHGESTDVRRIRAAYRLDVNDYQSRESVQLVIEWLEVLPQADITNS